LILHLFEVSILRHWWRHCCCITWSPGRWWT